MKIEVGMIIWADYSNEKIIRMENVVSGKEYILPYDKNFLIIDQCIGFLAQKNITVRGYCSHCRANRIYFFTNYYTTNKE